MWDTISQIGITIFGISSIILVAKKINGVLYWDYCHSRFGILLPLLINNGAFSF